MLVESTTVSLLSLEKVRSFLYLINLYYQSPLIHLSTVSVHYIRPLYLYTTSVHCICTLHPSTVSVRYIHPLYLYTTSVHCICPLHPSTVSVHYIRPLYLYTTSVHCICPFICSYLSKWPLMLGLSFQRYLGWGGGGWEGTETVEDLFF